MLIIALSVGVAVAAFTSFVILCLGIRREDRTAPRYSAPTFAAKQARRFTGLRTQHSAARRCVTEEQQAYADERTEVDA